MAIATLLKNLGIPARDAQLILGNSRLAVTLRAALQGFGKTRAEKTPPRGFGGVLVAMTGRGKLPARVGR